MHSTQTTMCEKTVQTLTQSTRITHKNNLHVKKVPLCLCSHLRELQKSDMDLEEKKHSNSVHWHNTVNPGTPSTTTLWHTMHIFDLMTDLEVIFVHIPSHSQWMVEFFSSRQRRILLIGLLTAGSICIKLLLHLTKKSPIDGLACSSK